MNNTESLKDILPEKIEAYRVADETMKQAKKVKDPLNEEIKNIMRSAEVSEFEAGDYKAVFGVQERTSQNEELILQRLKEAGREDLIMTVEKPNMAQLERLMYDGEFDPSLLEGCFPTKIVETLSVKKVKKSRSAK